MSANNFIVLSKKPRTPTATHWDNVYTATEYIEHEDVEGLVIAKGSKLDDVLAKVERYTDDEHVQYGITLRGFAE